MKLYTSDKKMLKISCVGWMICFFLYNTVQALVNATSDALKYRYSWMWLFILHRGRLTLAGCTCSQLIWYNFILCNNQSGYKLRCCIHRITEKTTTLSVNESPLWMYSQRCRGVAGYFIDSVLAPVYTHTRARTKWEDNK